ncbi:hypothetical protein IQ273_04880 [Nodosilinea sp. LEGE 07298]|nr:hypothetical protein [Nodosilinea sp. LEGE 07298]
MALVLRVSPGQKQSATEAGRETPLAESKLTWLVLILSLAQAQGTSARAGDAIATLPTIASSIAKRLSVRKNIAIKRDHELQQAYSLEVDAAKVPWPLNNQVGIGRVPR